MAPTRTLTATLLATGSLVLLAACGGGDETSGQGGDELTYWARGANEAINQQLVDAWNETHDVQIELLAVPDDEYNQKLAAAVQAGTPPDVVTVDVVHVPRLARGGALDPITDQAKELPFFDTLFQSYVDYSTYEGDIYALPENVDASTLYWNKNLFEQAGLDPEKPPRSFAELKEYAEKISALGDDTYGFYFSGQCVGCNDYTFSPLVWASGGDFVSEDGTTATLTDPAVADALRLYRDLWESGAVPDQAETDTGANWVSSFGSGNIGMIGLGAFAISQMSENFPDVDYGVATLPGKDGGESSFTGGDVIAIPSGAEHPDAAWEFVKWSLTDAAQVDVYAKNGKLVARSDLIENEYATENPKVVAHNRALQAGRLPVYHPNSAEIDAPTGPFNSAFQEIVFGGADPESVLPSAEEEFQRLLDQG
ncbi:carbohydrate ABC transporter substrate-binding protein (CUT1 family) [Haloactinopolyspora alba]|uniref:Carbohydrate ABC transporter substrate-binding protein (CUT1 family) n=1 Tax=Haloactinopolyspora alba TaxID=648780 RepID=A0A2P8DYA8_9ACTN|nr:ABC transporter substrate-binding protein [Haloactinopolyspora alba]PSL02172.1 carbohydrate ABC transporter substrate-binding protein (CUT1 family) [Haloactinopolyspora alba]